METLQIGTWTKQVPSTWNELKRKQLLAILPDLYNPPPGPYRLRRLALLSGYPIALLAGLPADVLAQLLPLVDFLEADDQLLTAQLVPTLRIPGRLLREPVATWHGPRANLRNCSFGEFMFADTFFVLYSQYQRAAHLDKFLAVLYRPARRNASPADADWNGDVRQAFNEHQLEARTPRVAALDKWQKMAVLTWFRGCRAELAQEFPDVFAEAEEGTQAAQKAPEWERVLRNLSGGPFGTVEQTAAQPLRLILAEMQDAAVKYNQLKTR